MMRLLVWCVVIVVVGTPVEAVTLRVETVGGDSTFFAPEGDTVSVALRVDSEDQVLTGVEVFLQYDPRFFAVADTIRASQLFGTVLIDTTRALSDSVAVVHFADADLVGKAVTGSLFVVDFVILKNVPLHATLKLLQDNITYRSAYTTASDVGNTVAFEHIVPLLFDDLPPELHLPPLLVMKEDDVRVVDLQALAIDRESGNRLVWSVVSSSERVFTQVTDSLTVVLTPQKDFSGQVILEVMVTDGNGGQANGSVVLNVASVNDLPEWIAGALPDSVVLNGRSAVVDLGRAVKDVDGDVLVWSGQGTGDVGLDIQGAMAQIFAPVDWVGAETISISVSDGIGDEVPVSLLVVRRQPLSALLGDLNGDAEVNFTDFIVFAQAFGQANATSGADLNGDGRVDFPDFLIFAQNFGRKL
ncbi:MAG: cadherin-like domain-containing protein [Candidatus Latescibacterota bacterium]